MYKLKLQVAYKLIVQKSVARIFKIYEKLLSYLNLFSLISLSNIIVQVKFEMISNYMRLNYEFNEQQLVKHTHTCMLLFSTSLTVNNFWFLLSHCASHLIHLKISIQNTKIESEYVRLGKSI